MYITFRDSGSISVKSVHSLFNGPEIHNEVLTIVLSDICQFPFEFLLLYILYIIFIKINVQKAHHQMIRCIFHINVFYNFRTDLFL